MKKERTGKRRRIFAVFLCMCILFTTQPEIWNGFSVFAAGERDTKSILSFAELPSGIKEQTVSVGTGREELELPEELTVFIRQEENSSMPDTEETDTGETDTEESDTGETDTEETDTGETDTEESDAGETDTEETDAGETDTEETDTEETDAEEDSTAENNSETGEIQETTDGESTEEAEGITESDESAEADGSVESDAPEQAAENLPAKNDAETSAKTVTVELEKYYAEPEAMTVYTLENPEKETRQIQETVAGITWQSEPAYDGNTEGTYTFTAILPEGYALSEGASLPQITVTVRTAADALIQTLLARIDALPDAEEYLAEEPDVEDEDAYAAWEEKLYEYAEEALAIMKEYETLTEEQQAFISEEELAKLTAWTEIAAAAGESAQVMAAASHYHDGISFNTLLPADGGELVSGNYYLDEDVALKDTIVIPSGAEVYLCLNEHMLCRSENNRDYSPIDVYGKLHVYACSDAGVVSGTPITGDATAAVRVKEQGMLTLHSGKITANYTMTVYVERTEGTFHLYGGTVESTYKYGSSAINSLGTVIIGGNAVVRKGVGSNNVGCAVCNNSSNAVMTLKDNASVFSVSYGVENYGTFNMEGGTITSTSIYGAGIKNPGTSATLNIKGGTIVGEQYGILMSKIAYTPILNLSGSPEISGKKADLLLNTESGVSLDDAKVDATGYTGSALTVEENMSGFDYYGSYAIKTDEGNKAKFKLINKGWCYSYKDGGLYLDNHTHSYTYAAEGAVITESCTCGHEETATLSLRGDADLTYTGSAIKPVTITYSSGWAGTSANKPNDSKITYTNNTNPGTATAKLTIGGVAAQISFTIVASWHSHDDGATFDEVLPAAGGELVSGNYYLDEDVALEKSIEIPSGAEVNLCLNGHRLCNSEKQCPIIVYGKLHVYDCSDAGVVSGTSITGGSTIAVSVKEQGMPTLHSGKIMSSSTISVDVKGTFHLYGGTVENSNNYAGSAIDSTGTVIIGGNAVVRSGNLGNAVCNNSRNAVMTLKDNASLFGGASGVSNYGTFNLESGTTTSASTNTNGAGIENAGISAILNIKGGTVVGEKYGIYTKTNTSILNLSGSPAISGKTADLHLKTDSGVSLDNAKMDATGYTGSTLTVKEDWPKTTSYGSYAIKTDEGNKAKFNLINEGWRYTYKDGGLYLDNHTHSYTYTAEGAVITESCTCGHEETATLSLRGDADLTYTGSAIKPVTITYSSGWAGTGTNKPSDSKITYTNNTNPGTATAKLIVSGKTASLDFTISACGMEGAAVTLENGSLTYNGQEQTKGVTNVTVNGRTLTEGTDYTISGNMGKDAGEYTITITGKGNYSGTKEVSFKILPVTLTDDMVSIASGPHYYTGNAIRPVVTVQISGISLPDTDYTVSYEDNVEAGEAAVRVTGTGNINSSAPIIKHFTIQCRTLPSGQNLTDYVNISPSPNADGWYPSDITLTPKDGGSVGETTGNIGDSVVISEETGTDGDTKTIYIKDGEGNIYQAQLPYKLDKTPPVIDLANMIVENGTKGLWNWIIGKKSMIIKIPAGDITDTPSGIKKVTYETAPDSGTAQSGTLNAKGDNYEIALNAEFSGTIRLTAEDKAGNTTQVSLTADGGKVIAEDYAPVVTITEPDTPQPNANGWYTTVVTLTVTVTDDKDSGNNNITSGGIAKIKWKDGENGAERTVAGVPETSPVYEKKFTITADTDGTHIYYVQATDNAGNESGWQTVTVRLDTSTPEFSGDVSVTNRTQEGADVSFIPSEGGKAYWIVSDTGTAPDAQEVVAGAQDGVGKGGVQDVTGGGASSVTVRGLTSGKNHTVYIVLEDVAGNLSEVKTVSFTTLQKAPEIMLDHLTIDHEKQTVKLPAGIGEVEVYTNPDNPSGSKIQPETDGSLPVEPGTSIYIRYPEKTDGGVTTPASDAVKIDIPGRPAVPAPKRTTVTDTTVTVTNPAAGEEYILVPKGQAPDWDNADKVNQNGKFTGLDPNQEYELYVRKKATKDDFASESAKTEVRTAVTIEEPVVTGEGAGKPGNTVLRPDKPDEGGATVTFTGSYGEEYTPVITIGGQTFIPGEGTPGSEMTMDENRGKGKWKYTYEVPDGASDVQIAVEFKKRAVTGITVQPGSLTIYADDAANESRDTLTAYLKDHCKVQAVYDNRTKGTVQGPSFTTTDNFAGKGAAYHYTVSVGGKTGTVTLTVKPVTASVQRPDTHLQRQKDGGYTAQEVNAWLPAQLTVTYTGTGYKTRTEKRAVTWHTDSVGAGFGGTLGEKAINGTVELPAWATGQASVSMAIRFVDKTPLSNNQMQITIPGFSYGDKKLPGAQGSITVEDTNPTYTYLYSTDGGTTWVTKENLPKSDGGYIVPGEYRAKIAYTGDQFIGEKTVSFTVARKKLDILPGTLAVNDKNHDGTTDAVLKGNGKARLSGVVEGDKVTLAGTLTARFTEAGPKKDIPVTVTGFLLEGADSGYYEFKSRTLTLRATINNADGTPPSDGTGNNGNNGGGGNGGSGSKDNNGTAYNDNYVSGDNNDPGTPSVTPSPGKVTPPADTPQQPEQTNQPKQPKQHGQSETQGSQPEDKQEPESTVTSEPAENPSETGKEQQPGDGGQTIPAAVENGKIAMSGEPVATGNVEGMANTSTALKLGDGAVVVTVVCAGQEYTAGVADTLDVANAVLTPEQIQLVNSGETIEIRIDVEDISDLVPEQDKETIESGIKEYQKEVPELTLGMYVDISMFMRIGEGDWNAITATKEPIEIIIGIPEKLQENGRSYVIIRAHDGVPTVMKDMDDEPSTITVSTDLFSSYAIAYVQAEGTGQKCGLCHICPTFLGICCFVWLAIMIPIMIVVIIFLRKKCAKS